MRDDRNQEIESSVLVLGVVYALGIVSAIVWTVA